MFKVVQNDLMLHDECIADGKFMKLSDLFKLSPQEQEEIKVVGVSKSNIAYLERLHKDRLYAFNRLAKNFKRF